MARHLALAAEQAAAAVRQVLVAFQVAAAVDQTDLHLKRRKL